MKRIFGSLVFIAVLAGIRCAGADAPTITQEPVAQIVTNGGTARFTVAASGTGPFTYQWQLNGANVSSVITTIAGNWGYGYSGDGGLATSAELWSPQSTACDDTGNLFIADSFNNRVRKVDRNGIITTIAGTGSNGYSGDGGPATNAELWGPEGITLDSADNLFFADSGNNCIRKVDRNGIIATAAGIAAQLRSPSGIAIDQAGNLFIADSGNNRIRKMDADGIFSTIAGNGNSGYSGDGGLAISARLCSPQAVALDAVGNLFVADTYNSRIRKVDTNGIITTVAGCGISGYSGNGTPATNAYLSLPGGLALDSVGNLLIAESCWIRQVNVNGIINVVAGLWTGSGTELAPAGIACDTKGNLFIADSGNHRVCKLNYLFATTPILTLTNAGPNNAGKYSVIVGTPYGTATSLVATLTVLVPPSITSHPTNQTVLVNGAATFSVSTCGDAPLNYYWLRNGTPVIGANDFSYSITHVQASDTGAQYSCVVSNNCGSITSRVATLTVAIPPTVTQALTSVIVTNGSTAVFNVAVSGTGPFTYQWQFNGTNLSPVITTVAGNGVAGYSGDGIRAIGGELFYPFGIASDCAGNLFIADSHNHRIRKVGTNGIVTTVAGNGTGECSGDGGPATNACLKSPNGVALDDAGNLYIADYDNSRVRKVDTNGIITTVAGCDVGYYENGGLATNTWVGSPSAIGLDHAGNLYIADNNNHIRKVDTNGIITNVAGTGGNGYGGDGGPATRAYLYNPQGVALDDEGNLYIADSSNNRVRKVDTNGIISTIAGGGPAVNVGDGRSATNTYLDPPSAVALDHDGNLLIGSGSCIRKVDACGIITTVAGNGTSGYLGDGGPATGAMLNYPGGVALDNAGNLFIADSYNQRIRKLNYLFATTPVLTLTNAGPSNAGKYSVIVCTPYGTATSQVATLTALVSPSITSQPANQIVLGGKNASFSVSASGDAPLSYFWLRNGTPIAGANNSTYSLENVQASASGAQFSCLVSNNCGSVTSQVATLTVVFPPTITQQPTPTKVSDGSSAMFTVAVTGSGPFTYQWQLNGTNVAPVITTVAGNGSSNSSGDGLLATSVGLCPNGVALDADGNLFIIDIGSHGGRIRKVDASGIITTIAGNGNAFPGDGGPATNAGLRGPEDIVVDGAGNLFICDSPDYRIRKVDTNGIITTVAGNGAEGYSGDGGPATNAMLYPSGIAVDSSGNLFIADPRFDLIRKVDVNGTITTVVSNTPSTSNISQPQDVAVDGAGNLFVLEPWGNRILKVATNGIMTDFAGDLAPGYSGDGGPAIDASLWFPSGVALDRTGNLFIADTGNRRIRKVDTNGIITTVAGTRTNNYSGDGGPALNAGLTCASIALDDAGSVFITDYYNNRVRKVSNLPSPKPALTLPKVGINDAGDYSVIVSSPYGCVTSSVAKLSLSAVLQPQSFAGSVAQGTNVALQFKGGTPSYPYVLQSATSLDFPINWQPVVTNSTDENGGWNFTVTNAASTPTRFYRVLGQ